MADRPNAAPPLQNLGDQTGGAVRSLRELATDPSLTAPPAWDWHPYTAEGRLTLLSAPPKSGKTTLAAHYAAAKSLGRPFLGQELQQGLVLWVGPDEHLGDQVRRFTQLGAAADNIGLWAGPVYSIQWIAEVTKRIGASLVVLDTLPRIARIQDENDNAAWTMWSSIALQLVRDSDAVWFALHHHRKGGGSGGEAIRGGSAILGFVYTAVSLAPVSGQVTRRLLSSDGTRYESAPELLVELREDSYVALGEPGSAPPTEGAERLRVRKALRESTTGVVRDIVERSGLPESTVRRWLDEFTKRGEVRREGRGGQRDPYRYFSTAPEPMQMERRTRPPAGVREKSDSEPEEPSIKASSEEEDDEGGLEEVISATGETVPV